MRILIRIVFSKLKDSYIMSTITKTKISPVPSPHLSKVDKAIRCLKKIFSRSVKKVDTEPHSLPQLEVMPTRLEEPRSAPPRRVRRGPKPIETQPKSMEFFDTFSPDALSPKLRYALSPKQLNLETSKNWNVHKLNPNVLPAFQSISK